MSARNLARLVGVLALALVLQVAVLDQIVVAGAHPDLLIVVAAAAGLLLGPQRGAVVGFAVGIVADTVVNLPFGLSALTYVLVAFGVGMTRSLSAGREARSALVLVCAAAAAIGTFAYALIGALLGAQGMLGPALVDALVVVTLGALVLALPAIAALRWAFAGIGRVRGGFEVPSGGSAAG